LRRELLLDLLDHLHVKFMSSPIGNQSSHQRPSQEVQVPNEVEHHMAYQLISPTEPSIQNPVGADYHRILEGASLT